MKNKMIGAVFVLLLFAAGHVPAKSLYTWTDKDGVVHITETKPPAGAQKAEKTTYQAKPKNESPEKTGGQKKLQREAMLMEGDAQKKAKRARREADIARKAMDEAIEKANRMKTETDVYIQQWGIQARHRKSIKVKIDRKKDATNQAVAEAQSLTKIATEKEAKAREAEKQLADLRQLSKETSDYTQTLEAEAREPAAQAE